MKLKKLLVFVLSALTMTVGINVPMASMSTDSTTTTETVAVEAKRQYTESSLVTYTRWSPYQSGDRWYDIDTITIHCMAGQMTGRSCVDWFSSPDNAGASSQYCVGYDGSIGQAVSEGDRSWCTSSGENDHRAITIEVASDMSHPYAVRDAAYNALLDLLVDILQRNPGIGKLRWYNDSSLIGETDANGQLIQNMTLHEWYANKSCPGEYLKSRHYAIADEVNRRLGLGGGSAVEVTPEGYTKYYPYEVTAVDYDIRVRRGPGTNYGQVGSNWVDAGTTVQIDGLCEGSGASMWGRLADHSGWIGLDYTDWVSADDMTVDPTPDITFPYVTTLTSVPVAIHPDPDSNSTATSSIDSISKYTITEESVDDSGVIWGKLKSGVGWINMAYTDRNEMWGIVDPNAPTDPETPPTTDPETPPTTEPETPPVTEPETPPTTEPETPPTTEPEAPREIQVGDLVSIKAGAYYNMETTKLVPDWVLSMNWYVSNIAGERVVLGASEDGSSEINSPFYLKDLTLVGVEAEPETPPTTEPETPPVTEPETPPTTEPETPPVTEPETPPTTEPETPVAPVFEKVTLLVKVDKSSLSIYATPGTDGGAIGAITDMGKYYITEKATLNGSEEWGRLKHGNGWIALADCTIIVTETDKEEVANVKVGDTVKITEITTWYNTTKEIPSWILREVWIVKKVEGDLVMIDSSVDGTFSINSPIKLKDVDVVETNTETVVKPSVEIFEAYEVKVTISVVKVRSGAGSNNCATGVIIDNGAANHKIVAVSEGKGAKLWGKLANGGWISLDDCVRVK